jgi:hypothetical protein
MPLLNRLTGCDEGASRVEAHETRLRGGKEWQRCAAVLPWFEEVPIEQGRRLEGLHIFNQARSLGKGKSEAFYQMPIALAFIRHD